MDVTKDRKKSLTLAFETKSMTPGTENTSELENKDESVPFESIVDRIKNSLKPKVHDTNDEWPILPP